MSTLDQVKALRVRAKHHETLGNYVLAKWLRNNADNMSKSVRKNELALDKMALGNYADDDYTRVDEFRYQWYAYEDEYAYNFSI